MALNWRISRLGMALVVTVICLGCGSADHIPPAAPPSDQPAGERRADAQAIDEAIAAVERGGPSEIVLRDVHVSGAHLRRIAKSTALRELDLGTAPLEISDDDVLALRDLVELRVLVLGAAPITDRGLAVVREMRELQRLNVVQTRVTDDGLELLAGLPKLELLRIGSPAITDAGVARLKAMKQLKRLLLQDCPLTDGSLPDLLEMRHLESLYLYGTRISDEGLANLHDALRGPPSVHLHY